MIAVELYELKAAIQSLPKDDYNSLRDWFSNRDWEFWDRKIEKDSKHGKLDFLVDEAFQEKANGELRSL